jgi:hypothetical protein
MTKQRPTIPLPWTAHGLGISGRIDPVARVKNGKDRLYIAHAANAYPRLVLALRDCANWMADAHEGTDQWERGTFALALLRELGEE